jgi:Tfp pilus assembly protein PilF
MSLLLDALKRAEQEKLAKQGERAANDSPAAQAPPAAPPRRDPGSGALELQPIAGAPGTPPPPAAGPAKPSAAATAQAVFQAKAAATPPGESRKALALWIGGAVVLLVGLGIGGYIWYSVSALQPKITTLRPRPAPTPAPASGAASPPRTDTLVQGANAPFTMPTPPASGGAATSPPTQTAPASAPPDPAASPPPASTPRTATARIEELPARGNAELAARLAREAPPAPQLRLTPTEPPRVPTNIVAGYDALRAGDLPAARRSYAAALAADPASVDANLGLATVEARMGSVPAAASHYRRVLDLDPRNPPALAGLASMADLSQPELVEQQLRADLARYPQSAALHFALGNLYASRNRWEEAQSSFFEALRLEPASADTLYNLAVAMDHMKQERLASEYYARALEAGKMQTTQFDPARVARRIAELKP